MLVTDLTTDGALRGYAQFDSWKLAVALGSGSILGETPSLAAWLGVIGITSGVALVGLSKAGEAHAYVQARKNVGKVLFDVES